MLYNVRMIHHIQRSIINVLAHKDPARYADLKPEDLDGNKFTYHLKQVVSAKLVDQNDDGTYSLTPHGRAYLVHRYEDSNESAHTIFLVVLRHGDKLLLRRRLVQPSNGFAGFIHGEPVSTKPLEESVKTRILGKTGLEISNIKVHASGFITMVKGGQPESFSHAIIISADTSTDELPIVRDETGENFWINESDIDTTENLLQSCPDILKLVKTDAPGWFNWTYNF